MQLDTLQYQIVISLQEFLQCLFMMLIDQFFVEAVRHCGLPCPCFDFLM